MHFHQCVRFNRSGLAGTENLDNKLQPSEFVCVCVCHKISHNRESFVECTQMRDAAHVHLIDA